MTTKDDNLRLLTRHLRAYGDKTLPNHIGGSTRPALAGRTFENRAPTDGSLIIRVAQSDASDVDAAARAAKSAFPAWRDTPPAERKRILLAIADGIAARAEEIALLESWDTGQPIRYMAQNAKRGAEHFRYFAERAMDAHDGQARPTEGLISTATRSPIGPVGIITPWNTPFLIATWKIAPALAAGCTVVHKPAEAAPLTSHVLLEIARAAGLPDGAWNLLNGLGPEAGRALTEHPAIRAIAFVGDSDTGRAIMTQCAPTLKRVQFELGGKNPIIVFDDADLERALDAAILMIYALNGERCTSSSRLLIHDAIADTFEARLAERARNIVVGHPLDPATEVGPLIHRAHFEKVRSYLDLGTREGATLATGEARADDLCVTPSLFTHATNDMRIAREEIFGPILTSIRFSSEEEAIALANDTEYGLTGYVWTRDLTRAMRITKAVEAGMIWVNAANSRHLAMPFGGMKASGIGRDGGDWSLEFFMEQKMVALATDDLPIPRLGVS